MGRARGRGTVGAVRALGLALVAAAGLPAPDLVAGEETSTAAPARTVGILVFDGVELLDFAGPGEVFAVARRAGQPLFRVSAVGLRPGAVRSQGFLAVTPDTTVDGPEVPDIAVVPGGDVTGAMKSEAALRWLSRVTAKGGVVFTVCNGASVAAKAGLLDGKDVTTHHGNADLLSLLAPSARVHVDRRVVDNDRLVTAAGISAGIDGALYLVARLGGMEVARAAATHMEYEPWPALETQIAAALEQPGTRSVRGRTFTATEDWAIFRVLRVLRASGAAPAEEELRRSLASARGHDLEMIEAAGLAESAQWLLESSRDPAAVLPLFDLNARVNPGSVVACDARAGALERLGRAEEARAERGRCSRLAPAAAGER